MSYTIEVLPYDPIWPAKFAAEAARLHEILGAEIMAVHHIGSTSVPGIKAKPIIDILLEVRDITRIDAYNAQMEAYGYLSFGEYGLPRRRYFPRNVNGRRVAHIHSWQSGDPEIGRHLAFRDYLRTHPIAAAEYGALKAQLAVQFCNDRDGYLTGKHDFVVAMERKALQWQAGFQNLSLLQPVIETARLQLWPLSQSHLEACQVSVDLLAFALKMPISRAIWEPPVVKARQIKIQKMARVDPAVHPWYTYWLIVDTAVSRGVGLVGFKGSPDRSGVVEIGYGLDVHYQRRGYATEAVQTMIDWAFTQPDCKVVTAWVRKDNPASQRVLQKVGMRFVRATLTQLFWRIIKTDAR